MADTETTTAESKPPMVGDRAPDFELIDTEDRPIELSTLWRAKPLVLVFLRHLGCTFCRQQLAWLRQSYAAFGELGVEVACVAQGDAKIGKAYKIAMELPFPLLLCGFALDVYRLYGLELGTTSQIFSLRTVIRGILAVAQGYKQTALVGKGSQLGGAFIVDTSGTVRYCHRSADAADNLPSETLLSEVRKL